MTILKEKLPVGLCSDHAGLSSKASSKVISNQKEFLIKILALSAQRAVIIPISRIPALLPLKLARCILQ